HELDRLLLRLQRRKGELLKVLERPESHSTPMRQKTICAPSLPSARSSAAPWAATAAWHVTRCWACSKPAGSWAFPSTTSSATAWELRARRSRRWPPWFWHAAEAKLLSHSLHWSLLCG